MVSIWHTRDPYDKLVMHVGRIHVYSSVLLVSCRAHRDGLSSVVYCVVSESIDVVVVQLSL